MLTKSQQAVYLALVAKIKAGQPPTYRELARAVGNRSTNSIYNKLTSLERKGFIRLHPGRPRCIELLACPNCVKIKPTVEPQHEVPVHCADCFSRVQYEPCPCSFCKEYPLEAHNPHLALEREGLTKHV